MTELARRFVPGPEPSGVNGYGCGGLLILAGVLWMISAGLEDYRLVVVGAGVAFLIRGKLEAAKHPGWLEKVRMYAHGWICLQCGHSWIP
jgi:hypothetical protein